MNEVAYNNAYNSDISHYAAKGGPIHIKPENRGKLVDFSRPPYSVWAGYDNAV